MPGANRIDSVCRGPGEGVSTILTELGYQGWLGETTKLPEGVDAEPLEPLNDERIDG